MPISREEEGGDSNSFQYVLEVFYKEKKGISTSTVATVAAWARSAVRLVDVAREPRGEEAASRWAAVLERVEILEPHPL